MTQLSSGIRKEENAHLLEENQRLLHILEERNAELAILQSVQEGLASNLDMQSIYDLVGDKIREIFHDVDVEFRIYDPKTNFIRFPYFTDRGQRLFMDPIPLTERGISSYVLRTAQTLVINENLLEAAEKFGSRFLPGGHPAKSAVFVPLIAGHQAYGLIGLGNVEREHAFSKSDVRLLETLANSMSTALENVRLFDETQHLLKETEQRAAELAIINSVQEGLASKLDIQSIYEMVGEQLHQVFPQFDVSVAAYDPETDLVTTGYMIEHGQRIDLPPFQLEDRGFIGQTIRTRKTVLVNENLAEESRKIGSLTLPGTDRPKSHVIVPLLIHKVVRGLVVMQDMQREQAFSESDIRLLETIANSMSIALENARLFDETQRLLRETEQRNAELAIINSVQEGLASKLDMQAIYDLVGDKIRDLFNAQSVWIQIFDPAARTRQFRYGFYRQRLHIPEALPYNKLIEHLIAARKPLVINQDADAKIVEYEMVIVAGSERFKSAVFVPLLAEGEAKGLITLQNMEQENAFSESDINLLSTLASSMSVALENARLFDETQRLLKETEQRNAELAIINSVQAGLAEGQASKRDMQAIYDLVGDKIRELFPHTDTEIRIHDAKANVFQVPYYLENGQRIVVAPISLSDATISAHVLRTGQALVVNENVFQEMEKYGAKLMHGRKIPAKSVVFVPLMVGNQARGLFVLNNVEREHAFSPADVRLLQTLASSMSTALENARLFDETQRLLEETEQRAAELAIINSVQEGLASNLDMQAIYDLVGDKIRDLFSAQSVWILTFDRDTKTRRVEYSFENGQRYYTSELLPFNKLTEYLMTTKKTFVINQNADTRIAEFEMSSVAGTERFKSAIFVPLITDGEVKGFISLQNIAEENAFSASDISLLSTLASSMSVALENARLFDETQRLLKETEQRAAELTIINSVQAGIASKLDAQMIYELVGEKLRQVFQNRDVTIAIYDRLTDLASIVYSVEHGQRLNLEPIKIDGRGFTGEMIRRPRTIWINENVEEISREYDSFTTQGTSSPRSFVNVPLVIGGALQGILQLQDMYSERSFSEADVRLLETLAASMSISLENIRLFDETQRLLKETEQRAAELAIITSVQQGLSSKLEMQAIYELVGDKMQEIFDAQSLLIVTFDHTHELAHVTYNREKGIRHYADPYPFTGLHRHLMETGKTVVINENALEWQAMLGMILLPGTEAPQSMIFVPLNFGNRVSGLISLQNLERERAFSDTDVRLLETLASSMSVALENASLFDETQRLFLEAKEARMAAEQADQAKSAFLSSMSHELRTPLNAIINFVEMVARGMIGPVNQDQVELLDQALHSSKHLLNLINDVLDISKIQAGQLTLFIEDQVSVHVEVEAALSIVGGLVQEKGLQLIRDIDPHLPVISCDRRRLRQVLLNLIGNAIKFTDKGTVTVSAKDQGQELLFAVIDTGPGLPPDKQSLIFEPFLQAENGERQLQGTGLGLPISRSLIRAHGGELWVESEQGEGCAFFFTLPVGRRNIL